MNARLLLTLLVTTAVAAWWPAVAPASAGGLSVRLVVAAGRDSTVGFQVVEMPAQGSRILAWDHGTVTVPDSLVPGGDEGADVDFPLTVASLSAVAEGRDFPLEPGRYRLDAPLLLGDGVVVAHFASGELTIQRDRIIYRQPEIRRNPRGDFLLLGGLALATAILLRLARRRTGRS